MPNVLTSSFWYWENGPTVSTEPQSFYWAEHNPGDSGISFFFEGVRRAQNDFGSEGVRRAQNLLCLVPGPIFNDAGTNRILIGGCLFAGGVPALRRIVLEPGSGIINAGKIKTVTIR